MARMPEFQPLYDAFERFLNRCILDDRSLIWPDQQAWTPENVAELKRRMIDTPIFGGDLSFEEKLQEQMKGASPQHWMIMCDVYYVYFLPSCFITLEKRQNDIAWAARQGGLTPPAPDDPLWEPHKHGFTRTSLKYHYKYAQFWLILFFADHLKQASAPQAIVQDPQRMQDLLDELLEGIPSKNDRAYDMRHAMLYLAFPDHYERSISTRDKERILNAYRNRIKGQVPADLDEALRQIRTALSPEHDKPDRLFDFYDDLKDQWRSDGGPSGGGKPPVQPLPEKEDVSAVLSALGQTRNLILYGPPGTGKTYVAKKAAEALVEPQTRQPLSEPALLQRIIEDLSTYEVIALAMYRAGAQGRYTVPQILEQPVMQNRQQISPVKYPLQNTWGHLQAHTSPESSTVQVANRREPYLFDKDEQSRWFLTDQGREYVEQSFSEQLSALGSGPTARPAAGFVMWATFHQSYAYEDFVEGLRPIPSEESPGDVSYAVVPGIFRRICARAAADPDNKYVLVIDEINRGNIAKILGELITLLEDDKRAGASNPLSLVLPYSGETFSVPGNLYLIGTMNTADRSIALLDVALRRRFAFVELMPQPELLDGSIVESQEAAVDLGSLLRSLNQGIRRHLDRDHQIGHSYFLQVAQADEGKRVDVLEFVWNHQVVPLLEEYFYSQRDRLAELLAPFQTDVEPGVETPQGEIDFEPRPPTVDDLIAALAKLAEKNQ